MSLSEKPPCGVIMYLRGLLIAIAAVASLCGPVTSAQAAPSANESRGAEFSMGLGYLHYQRPYIGKDYWNRLLPLFDVNTRHFYVHGLNFGWRAWRWKNQSLDIVARPDPMHYNASENPALAGMTTKLATVMGGVAWKWRFHRHLVLDTMALGDLLRRNDGIVLSVGLNSPWHVGAWFFRPDVALQWQSSNYVNYYFGVTSSEARSGRPQYAGKSSINEKAGFSFGRHFAGHFTVAAGAYMTHFGSGVSKSPIVGHTNTTSFLLGLYYHF